MIKKSDCINGFNFNNGKSKIIAYIFISFTVLNFLCSNVFCQADPKGKRPVISTATHAVQGEVAYVSKDYISIIYQRSEDQTEEYEMMLSIDEALELTRVASLDKLNIGDTVTIDYDEITEEYPDGPRSRRKAKNVAFTRPAAKEGQLRGWERR